MRRFNAVEVMPRHVQITLETYATNEAGDICLSPTLVSEREVDEHIDDLIEELRKAGKTAKKKLRRELTTEKRQAAFNGQDAWRKYL